MMTRIRAAFGIAAVLGALAILTHGARAASIPVDNYSFETLGPEGLPDDGCGAGCSYSVDNIIPGWSVSTQSNAGLFQPGDFPVFNYLPDGITVAYGNAYTTISQTVAATAQPGVTYTLQVDLGFRTDITDSGTVTLWVGGNQVIASGTPEQESGNWVDYIASYTATAADIGDPIMIVLSNPGTGQADFDDVRLSDNLAVPEPASLVLFGGALAAWARFRRRGRALS